LQLASLYQEFANHPETRGSEARIPTAQASLEGEAEPITVKGKKLATSQHRLIMRLLMFAFYLAAGFLHLVAPAGFILIVPSIVPWPETTVLITGILEIVGAIVLLTKRFRYVAGIGLAAYAICVFPANVNHALMDIHVGSLPTSWWYHGPRFLLQPMLVWWALYCSEVTDWPRRSS